MLEELCTLKGQLIYYSKQLGSSGNSCLTVCFLDCKLLEQKFCIIYVVYIMLSTQQMPINTAMLNHVEMT